MSWQVYVDEQLLATGKVTHAAILGQQGGVWAIKKGFTLADDEQAAIIAAFNNLDHTQSHGLKVGGEKYFTTTAETTRILGMKGPKSLIVVKTIQAIIVGVSEPPVQLPEMSAVVEKLGDYLRSLQY